MLKSFIVTQEIVRSITILNVANEQQALEIAKESFPEQWSNDFIRSETVVEEKPELSAR